jgi:hypothetical protein
MRGRTRAVIAISSIGILAMAAVGALSGIAAAVSGGGYSPDQQDCPWNSDAWNTPPGAAYPGCHSIAINVESGGQTNGQADQNNTRYVEWGDNQNPVDPNSQGTPTILGIGYPGNTGSPHAGCVAVNDDGTDGGGPPPGTGPESEAAANNQSQYGCGNNPNGTGFQANYDTFALYCPELAMLADHTGTVDVPGGPSGNDQVAPCEDSSYASSPLMLNQDTGQQQALTDILTKGLIVYFGMDDNSDNSEHDGFDGCSPNSTNPNSCLGTNQPCTTGQTFCNPNQTSSGNQTDTGTDGAINGPSDGGSMLLSIEPQWLLSPTAPTATQPEGLVNFSEGECADGICGGTTTQQQTVYYGCYDPNNPNDAAWQASGTDGATNPQNNSSDAQCAPGTPESGNVYENNAPASTEESANCNGGGPYGGSNGTESPCFENANGTTNPGGANYYRQGTPQQMNTEPGVQTYQDPDPQRSPAAPFATPGAYAGTCGVYLNDGGGYGEPGLSGFLTGGNVSLDPGYIVETPGTNCG